MKRYIVVAEMRPNTERRVNEMLKAEPDVGWWHWVKPMWLLRDHDERSAKFWLDKFKAIDGVRTVFVQEGTDQWSAFVNKKGHSWLEDW